MFLKNEAVEGSGAAIYVIGSDTNYLRRSNFTSNKGKKNVVVVVFSSLYLNGGFWQDNTAES